MDHSTLKSLTALFALAWFVNACSEATFSGNQQSSSKTEPAKISDPQSSAKKLEQPIEEPTDVAGGYGLTCKVRENLTDSSKLDIDCSLMDKSGTEFQDRPEAKLLVVVKAQDHALAVRYPNAGASSPFGFTVAKADAETVFIDVKIVNPADASENLTDLSAWLNDLFNLNRQCPSRGCYDAAFMASVTSKCLVNGPENKIIEKIRNKLGFEVWKEQVGGRILNATGLIQNGWQKKLNRKGLGFDGDLTDEASIAGRVCPPNVFLDYSNMTAEGRCMYYDARRHTPLNLGKSGGPTSNYGIQGEDYLISWDDPGSGKGVLASFYEGNINTCANVGMRLPTIYETTLAQPQKGGPKLGFALSLYEHIPTGDSISPKWAGRDSGVPNISPNNGVMVDFAWTASALQGSTSHYYWQWRGDSIDPAFHPFNFILYQIRCVLPSH